MDGVLLVAVTEAALLASGSKPMLARLKEPADHDPSDSFADLLAKARAELLEPGARARARREAIVVALACGPLAVWVGTRQGRTPGRVLAGVRLQRHDGRPVTTAQAVVRDATPVVRYVLLSAVVARVRPDDPIALGLAQLGALLAGLPVVGLDLKRRSMGDWLAGTRLVAGP